MTTYTRIKEEGKIEGKLEGMLEGKLEGKIELILSAYGNGLAINMIANITQLTESDVNQILKDHKKI